VKLLAASFDTSKDNHAFAETHGFRFTMLSDVNREVGERYETRRHPDEQSPEFAKRRTFLIDPQGVIRKVYRVRDIPAHPEEVLRDLRELMDAEASDR
jgi:thioredoxin-dependent peroxiredoxin